MASIWSFNCPGPMHEDTGQKICRMDPDLEEFDCDQCWADYEAHQELLGDIGRDEGGWIVDDREDGE